ncbi:MAG: DUF2510 domain-containing protein [Actinomycetota bacterium]
MTTLAAPGWYPDPTGGTRLRWWDGDDWSDHYRTRPLHTMTEAVGPAEGAQATAVVGGGIRSTDVDRIVAAVQTSARSEMDRAVGELQTAARTEVDRVVGEVRRQAGNVTPLITETVGQLARYVRWAAVIGFLLVVGYFVFQVVAGIGVAELISDIADRVIDAIDDDSAPAAPPGPA